MRSLLPVLVIAALSVAPDAQAESTKLREHAEDIADYTLSARLEPAQHTVAGKGTIRFRNTSSVAVRELWLHLYLNAFKNERSRFMREASDGRGSGRPREWGGITVTKLELLGAPGEVSTDLLPALETARDGDADETDARVPLPREILPGAILELAVEWASRLPSIVERTGYTGSFYMVGQWFPKIARLESDGTWAHFPFHHLAEFYADFGTYDVTVDVPAGYVIGATGPVVETRTLNGRTVERHVQSDVHDFAWTAWDHFAVSSFEAEGVKVTLLTPEHYDYVREREADAVKFGLRYFGENYGAYPYKTLTVVHPPEMAEEAGGMEYPTLVTTGGSWYGPPFLHVSELVTLHELGHEWFYGLLASNEEQSPWLDEGLNSFAEEDSLCALFGSGSVVSLLGWNVSTEALYAVAANRAAHHHAVAASADSFAHAADYGALVYARTATLLETLRRVYGDPFKEALGDYARTYRFRHPTAEDALGVFRAHLGERAAEASRATLYDKGWVDYEVVAVHALSTSDPKETATGQVNGEESPHEYEILVRRMGTVSLPSEVKFLFADGSSEIAPWAAESDEGSLYYRGPKTMTGAIIDPSDRILLDMNRMNNQKAVTGGAGHGATTSIEWLLYWATILVNFITR